MATEVKKMTTVFRKSLVVLAALLGLTGTAMGQIFYHVKDLGTFPGDDERKREPHLEVPP